MMLDFDTVLEIKVFDSSSSNWSNSSLESWLNGDSYYGNTFVFTTVEKNAIAETALSEKSTYTAGDYSYSYQDYAAEDYVYLLSAEEADTLYANNDARIKKNGGNAAYWWLRSALAYYSHGAGVVDSDGDISPYVDYSNDGVSPALNIDLSSVLFTSANGVNKSSAGGSLTQVAADATTKAWKLTLLDESKTVKVTDRALVTQIGKTITVPYTYTGSDVTQISVMITDGDYTASGTEILYYGKLDTDLSSSSGEGSGTFILPDGLPDGYKIYILAEKVNGEKISDYASAPAEITVAVVETPEANLTGGTYSENQSVTLSSATDGASIYYTMTTDGSEPADPTAADTPYTEAISLTGTEGSSVTYQMKAVAVKGGMVTSSIASFAYTISIPETYAVTVVNGTGGGDYAEGETVTITADTAGSGKRFREWTGVDGLTFAENTDKTSATATFTMPANDVAVTAVYESIPSAGSGSGVTTQPQDAPIKEDETAAPEGVEVTTVVYRDEQENVTDASAEVTTLRTGKTGGVNAMLTGNVVAQSLILPIKRRLQP